MIPVSLCMICRDNSKTIGAVLDDVRAAGIVQLCVVDTGSVDDTVQIAESKGATVTHREWRDDFAWAKNEALKQATTDWCFILDSDDRISDPAELRRFLEADLPNLPDTTHAIQMDVSVGIGPKMTTVTQVKFIRKSAGLHFRYPIHENINTIGHEIYYLREVQVNHHNAFDVTHNERNMRILLRSYNALTFEFEPQEYQQHIRLNLGREYLGTGKNVQALKVFGEFFAHANEEQANAYWARYYHAVATLKPQKRLERFQKAAACNPGRAEAWVEMARVHMQEKRWRAAMTPLWRAMACPYPEDGVAYPPDYTWRPLMLLAACHGELGEQDKAWSFANAAKAKGAPPELIPQIA